jgi:hypothetical protein
MIHHPIPSRIRTFGITVMVTSMVFTPLSVLAQSSRTVRLDSGTVIPVTLDEALSSNESHRGDTFTATLRTDNGADYDGLPAGTQIEGKVVTAKPQQDKNPGVLELAFQRLRLPDGSSTSINGSLIGLDNKSVTRTSDGRLIAKPNHKNDRLIYAGYGAGAGLIVGLLTKHALEDVVIGGGLGYLFASLQKAHNNAGDVTLKSGTEMGVRLNSRVAFTDNNGNNSDNSRGTLYHRSVGDSNTPIASGSDIGVMVADREVRFASTAQPIESKGVILIPAIPVLREAHVNYNWDAGRGMISTSGAAGNVRLSVGSRIAVINGNRRVRLDAPAQRLNGTIYVPAKFLSLASGEDYTYDRDSRTLILSP